MKRADLRKREDIEEKKHLSKEGISKHVSKSRSNIREIMHNDFRSCFKNPLVTIALIVIMIIPSLYAVVNIYACWNPYENTGNIKFAIANDDAGAKYENYTINAGNDLVDSLKNNTDFKWEFVSSAQLRQGVHNGTYEAGIIIPRNFSESIISITSDNPHSAQLEYIVNEKSNPVGGKLTDAAARSVYNKLNDEIVSFIDVAAYGKLDELQSGLANGSDNMSEGADKLDAGADKVQSGADNVTSGANQVSGGADQLASGAGQLSGGANQLATGSDQLVGGAGQLATGADSLFGGANQLASSSNQLASGAMAVSTGSTELSRGANQLAESADKVSSGAYQVADGSQQINKQSIENYNDFLKVKQLLDNGGDTSKLSDDVDQLSTNTAKTSQRLDELGNQSSEVSNNALTVYDNSNNLSDNAAQLAVTSNNVANQTKDISNSMNNVSRDMSQLKEAMNNNNQTQIKMLLQKIDIEMNMTNQKFAQVTAGSQQVANGTSQLAAGSRQLANGSSQVASGAGSVSNGANELAAGAYRLSGGAGQLSAGAHQVSGGAGQLSTGAHQLSSGAGQLQNGANDLSSGVHVLSNGTIELASGASLLGHTSASALDNASEQIGDVAGQLHNVTKLDQDDVGDYFFSPVKLQRHEEFPVNNYGSQVAPFYITLSMWVGAIVTVVMINAGTSKGTKYRPYEMYLGKLSLFLVMSIIETTITLTGCGILGIDIVNLPMFIFSAYTVALAFMIFIYSLVSVFGVVGEGLAMLLLVFQVSGTGGNYPIEIMSNLFRMIYPYLPMTHGITMIRESELGLVWSNYLPSFAFIIILGCATILVSILLKQRWDKHTKYLEDKLHESGIFN